MIDNGTCFWCLGGGIEKCEILAAGAAKEDCLSILAVCLTRSLVTHSLILDQLAEDQDSFRVVVSQKLRHGD
jgi:hypothetical protein